MFKSITSALLLSAVAMAAQYDDYETAAEQALVMSEKNMGNHGSMTGVNGGLDIRVPAGKDAVFSRLTDKTYDTAEVSAEIQGLNEGFQDDALSAITQSVDAVKAQSAKAVDATAKIASEVGGISARSTAVKKAARAFGPATTTALKSVADNIPVAETAADTAIAALRAHVEGKTAEIRAKVRAAFEKMKKDNMDLVVATEKPMTDFETATGVALRAIAKTHYVNKKAVVYRWNEWNGYSNNWGWFDGNNNRGFGGVHPSEWCDGNPVASQISNEMRYVKRLFSKRGHGDEFGSNICAYNWYMPHSTDDHRCGAAFRIKNTGTASKNWSVQWWFSGWSGWGNQASVAVNRGNHWSGDCYAICNRGDSFSLPANTAGTRVSTVIFMNGGSGNYGYRNNYRMSYLGLGNMGLPDGLEFVDDMETVGGNWS